MLRACLRPLGAPRRPIGADYPIVKSPVSFAATRQPMVLGQMQRRQFITLLIGAAAWPLAARAQPPDRVRRVGVLMGIADDPEGRARVMVFKQALHALGWIEGRNIQFIYRWSAGDAAHARQFANELLDLRSDVILANSTPIALAVRDASTPRPPCLSRSAIRSPPAWSKAWRDRAAISPVSAISSPRLPPSGLNW